MTGRLFSLIALPLSLLGHALFWTGSGGIARFESAPGSVAFVVAGIVVIAAAVATVAIGSLGVIVVGAVHILFSLLLVLVPIDLDAGAFSPAFEVINSVRGVSNELSDGMYYYFPAGAGVVTGAMLIAVGLAAGARRTAPTTRTRVLAGLAGLAGVGGLVLAFVGGHETYTRILMFFASADPLGLAMLLCGAVIVGAAMYSARWSSTGAIVLGAVTVVLALVRWAAPSVALSLPDQGLARAFDLVGVTGILLLVGVMAIVAGFAVRWRSRRLTH